MNLVLEREAIEAELARLVDGEARSSARACLFTLVIVCPESRRNLFEGSIDTLFGKRPCRIIYILTGNEGETKASVGARCKTDGARKSVCFEEITISCGEDGLGIDPRLWAPLLVADVPSYLFWLDRVLALPGRLFEGSGLTDRLIIDSSVLDDMGEGLIDVYSMLTLSEMEAAGGRAPGPGGAFAFSDFSWLATNELRIVTADAFDPPKNRALLSAIREVRVETGKRPHGILYFLWLACRLGWKHEEGAGDKLLFSDREGGQVSCELLINGGNTCAIRFAFDDGSVCSIAAGESGCSATFEPDGKSERFLCSMPDVGNLLLEETDRLNADPIFGDVVRFAVSIKKNS